MIKKCLGVLCILWLTFWLSFSNAFDYKVWNTNDSWRIGSIVDWLSFSPYDDDYMFMVQSLWKLKTVYWTTNRNMLYLNNNFIFFWNSWNPYFYLSNSKQGSVASYVMCDPLTSRNDIPTNCTRWNTNSLSDFFQSINRNDYYFVAYDKQIWVPNYPNCSQTYEEAYTVCLSSSIKWYSACFYVANYHAWVVCYVNVWLSENKEITTLYGSIWLDNPTFSTVPGSSLWNNSGIFNPSVYTWSDNNNSTNISDNDYVKYYQENPNYNFTADMCWIGTTDLTSNYWSNVAFHQWSWYTIFQFYSQLYWNTFKLSDVDTWLNSWLVNFNTFFRWYNRYSDWTPYYVLRYNWIWNLVIDKSNLTNPFIDNKIAYYFMSSNICDIIISIIRHIQRLITIDR